MQKYYKDLNIQFLPDSIIKNLNLETTNSLISQIDNFSQSLCSQLVSIDFKEYV